MELEYSRQIFEKYSRLKSMQIRPLEAGIFHTDQWMDERTDRQVDRQTDMTRPKDAFLSYAYAAKNSVPTSRKRH
jgi:hypothetical protein